MQRAVNFRILSKGFRFSSTVIPLVFPTFIHSVRFMLCALSTFYFLKCEAIACLYEMSIWFWRKCSMSFSKWSQRIPYLYPCGACSGLKTAYAWLKLLLLRTRNELSTFTPLPVLKLPILVSSFQPRAIFVYLTSLLSQSPNFHL